MKGVFLGIFVIIFISVSFYYRFEWYSMAEYIRYLWVILGLNFFIFVPVVTKEVSKNIIYFFGVLSGAGFILMIIYFSFIKVEIYDLKTHETYYYFKKDNLRGAYIYNPDNVCYQFAYNFLNNRLIFTPIHKKLYRVSFNTDLKFGRYFEFSYGGFNLSDDRDKNIDIYIKDCI